MAIQQREVVGDVIVLGRMACSTWRTVFPDLRFVLVIMPWCARRWAWA
jgi:hypothetical protein